MDLPLQLDQSTSLYEQIANKIVEAIASGRLVPGQKVPGSRRLAEQLAVHRNTVLAAYDELIAQGWLETQPKQGTFVCQDLPQKPVHAQAKPMVDSPGFAMRKAKAIGSQVTYLPFAGINFSGGVPDLRLAPTREMAQAMRRALTRQDALSYGDCRGQEKLRHQLALLLNAERGLSIDSDNLFVTPGSQGALHFIATALLQPGDIVAVAQLGYPPAWSSFRLAGARLVAIPVDKEGINTDKLAELLRHTTLRAVYLTPHHQYPTTVILSAARRLHLLALAQKHRFAIIEDDYDNEVHYRGRPILPLAASDRHGLVLYIGTLSKTLAPGLRIGYIVAPRTFLNRIAHQRHAIDRQGAPVIELAVSELLEDGIVSRHARKMRRVYMARRDFLASQLKAHFGSALRFAVPSGGLALWVRAPTIDIETWSAKARAKNLLFLTEKHYRLQGTPNSAFRLGYAACNEAEISQALAILRATLPAKSR